jgi:hypothetical protein
VQPSEQVVTPAKAGVQVLDLTGYLTAALRAVTSVCLDFLSDNQRLGFFDGMA